MKLFSTLPIPPEGVIREIAFRHYEKSEVCATVYLAEKEVCQKVRGEHKKGIVWMDKTHGLAKDLGKKSDVPAVRKMLETCKNGNALLVQTESGERSGEESTNREYPIVAVISNELLKNDGAVMVDYNGVCYGFGIILDGRARLRGDVGRGSRFNSALNYATSHRCYAVVFSEDKENGIRIIDGKKESLKLAQKRYCSDHKKGL